MGLPVTRVEVGIADGVATMKHPAVAHIDAHMGNPRRVMSPREKYQVTGFWIYLIMVVMRRTDVKTAPGEDSWRSCFT